MLTITVISDSDSRGKLHDVVTWNGFPTTLAALSFLCTQLTLTHPKPSQLGFSQVTMEARSSDATLHYSPSRSNSPGTVFGGHCPVKKQTMLLLSANQMMGRHVTKEYNGSLLYQHAWLELFKNGKRWFVFMFMVFSK